MKPFNFTNAKLIFILTLFCSTFSSNIKAEGWNGIYPLKSTHNDVVKILGKCKSNDSWNCLYESEEKNVIVEYSEGNCKNTRWNVSKGTVTGISIHLRSPVSLTSSQFNLKDFIEEDDPELVGFRHFVNEDKGLYFIARDNFIKSIYYLPTKVEKNKYECKEK